MLAGGSLFVGMKRSMQTESRFRGQGHVQAAEVRVMRAGRARMRLMASMASVC